MKHRFGLILAAAAVLAVAAVAGGFLLPIPAAEKPRPGRYAAWKNGPPSDASYFPIAVWLQDPRNAARYKAAGFNLYVGLWQGPTEGQLEALRKAGMAVICEQNEVGLKHKDDPTVVAWMHGDEPDNAQSLGKGKGYGPPVAPQTILADYRRIRAADPTRPVMLNLGHGVAYDGWVGRGVRSRHPEDYRQYVLGGDILSFDIYPVVHDRAEVAGKLWYVPYGVQRLVEWTEGGKIVWNCLECTHISNPRLKATPAQVRSEAWMAIIRGSTGLIYFVHQFQPRFVEAALLEDAEMLAAVTALNARIRQLAPVINSPAVPAAASVGDPKSPEQIALMVKQHEGQTYLFAANLGPAPAKVRFQLAGSPQAREVEVLDEDRRLGVQDGRFEDSFGGYDVHLYKAR